MGVPADAPILVAGSTHDGEEMILAEMADGCGQNFQNFFWCWCRAISSAAARSAKNCRHAA